MALFFFFFSFHSYFLYFFLSIRSFVASVSVVRMLAWFMMEERWCVGSLYGLSKYQ